jgi:hypothetical protein
MGFPSSMSASARQRWSCAAPRTSCWTSSRMACAQADKRRSCAVRRPALVLRTRFRPSGSKMALAFDGLGANEATSDAFVDSRGSNVIGWYRPSSSEGWLNDMALPPSAQLDE